MIRTHFHYTRHMETLKQQRSAATAGGPIHTDRAGLRELLLRMRNPEDRLKSISEKRAVVQLRVDQFRRAVLSSDIADAGLRTAVGRAAALKAHAQADGDSGNESVSSGSGTETD